MSLSLSKTLCFPISVLFQFNCGFLFFLFFFGFFLILLIKVRYIL
jgi:hypothetical protein